MPRLAIPQHHHLEVDGLAKALKEPIQLAALHALDQHGQTNEFDPFYRVYVTATPAVHVRTNFYSTDAATWNKRILEDAVAAHPALLLLKAAAAHTAWLGLANQVKLELGPRSTDLSFWTMGRLLNKIRRNEAFWDL